MPNITGGEILIILLVALIVLGPQRLPEAARTVAKAAREFRKVQTSVQTEIRSTIDEVTRPVTETATAMQRSIEETAKEVSPGGPGTHVDPGRRPVPTADAAKAAPASSDTAADRTAADHTTADEHDRGQAAVPAAPAAPAATAAGRAVFTPRGHDRAEPADTRRVDDWGEAELYDDAP